MAYGLHRGEVENDAEGLKNMLQLGKSIAWLGKCTKPFMDTFPADRGGYSDDMTKA
jgi:hypothetical protein